MNAEAKQIEVVATTDIDDNKDDPLNEIKCDDTIKQALIKFDYKEPTVEQLAEYMGFDGKYIYMLKVFWDPVYNRSWIVLSRTVIKEWFCKNDKGRDAVRNFNDRVLSKYDEGTDYKSITKTELDAMGWVDYSSNLTSKKESTRGGHNAKYHMVTGECFKMIAMERNRDIRRYYIKVEELAMFMKAYKLRLAQHQSEVAMLNEIKCDDTIKQALIKFDYKEPTVEQLAEYTGFVPDDHTHLRIIWDAVYAGQWMYFSDFIIVGRLTDETGPYAVPNYIKRKLLGCSDYTDGVSFKAIKYNDPLVLAYDKLNLSDLTSRKRSNNKRYYAITGDTYEDLLMKSKTSKGRESRLFYRKVANMARMMMQYISVLHQYIAAKHMAEQQAIAAKQLAEQKAIADKHVELFEQEKRRQDERAIILNSIADNLCMRKPNGYYYIATSEAYAKQKHFKLGITTNPSKRLTTYNCERPENDMIYFCFIHECHEPKQIESKLKRMLSDFQVKNQHKKQQDECFIIDYEPLHRIVKLVCDNYNQEMSVVNDIIRSYKSTIMNQPVVPPPVAVPVDKSLQGESDSGGGASSQPTGSKPKVKASGLAVDAKASGLAVDAKSTTVTITEQVDGKGTKTTKIDVTGATDEERRMILIQAIELFCKNDLGIEYNHTQHKDDSTKSITIEWKKLQAHVRSLCKIKTLNPWKTSLKSFITDVKAVDRVRWITARK